jgi:acetylornithine deacetylase/succinyl-diaminopimelate desuccinylase-like protein
MDIKGFITENRQRMLDELFDILRIPSVSADPAFSGDVRRCAEAVAASLKSAGASNVEVIKTPGHPIVFGEYQTSVDAPTVLVYGHYDVQPPDPIDLWDNPAFEPIIKVTDKHPEGAIFARGSCDDKGQMFMHVKALEAMVSKGDVPCNIKFIIEGEEEVGSSHLDDFIESNKEKLSADVVEAQAHHR